MTTSTLLSRLKKEGNPLIDGETVTFVWKGKIAPRFIDDLHNWDESPQDMKPTGPNLWTYSQTLPRDAYLEYAFLDPKTRDRLPDPFNPKSIWNGINAYNHYFYMPEGGPTPLIKPVKGIGRGTVTRHEVPTDGLAAGSKRTLYLYQPPVKEPVPLLVVYDGPDYLRRGKLNVIVDNLLAQKRIRPFAMAMVQNGRQARTLEYHSSDATLGFLMESVLPLASKQLKLLPYSQERYGVMGASMGGLMAVYTGMRLPQVFGKVLSQSGAFGFAGYEFVPTTLVRHAPKPDLQIWMDAGKLEWLLKCNRDMHALMKEHDYQVTYREFSGGHNYTAWRDDLWRGLEILFQ